jgi:hypothetical protein
MIKNLSYCTVHNCPTDESCCCPICEDEEHIKHIQEVIIAKEVQSCI